MEDKPQIKLEDTPEFAELMLKPLSELKAMLVNEFEFIGAEFLETKKPAVATLLTLRRKQASRIDPAVLPPTSAIPANEMKRWENKERAMREYCAKCPKVKTMIPYDLGEKPGAVAELQINGYKLSVLKGVYVDLPEPFAQGVRDSWQQTALAGSEISLDRVDPATGKKMGEVPALA